MKWFNNVKPFYTIKHYIRNMKKKYENKEEKKQKVLGALLQYDKPITRTEIAKATGIALTELSKKESYLHIDMVKTGLVEISYPDKDRWGVFGNRYYTLSRSKETFKKIAGNFLKREPFLFLQSDYTQQILRGNADYLSNYRRLPGLQSFFSRGLRLSPTFAKYLIFKNDAVVALMSSLLLSHSHIEDATITMEKGKIETKSFYGFTAALFTSLIVDAMKYPQLKKPVKSLLEGGPKMEADGKYKRNTKGNLIIAPAPRMLYEDFGFIKPHFSIHGKASLHDGMLEVRFSLPWEVVSEQLREWQNEHSKH